MKFDKLTCVWLMLVIALAACGQSPQAVAPQEIPPEYAGYLVARATATAGAVATQAAFATATEHVARASATGQYLATSDHLRFQQTEHAIQATATQAAIESTARSDLSTQSAAYTQVALEQQAQATGVALAAFEERQAEKKASAEAWGNFWGTVGGVVIAFLICATVIGLGYLFFRARVDVQIALIKALSELPPPKAFGQSHYMIFVPESKGYSVLPFPGQVALPPAGVIEHEEPEDMSLEQHWITAVYLWLSHGQRAGFSRNRMKNDGIVSEPGWNTLRAVCGGMGVVAGERATHLVAPHTPDSVRDDLRKGRLSIPSPYRDQEPPPVVAVHTTPLVSLVNTTHH